MWLRILDDKEQIIRGGKSAEGRRRGNPLKNNSLNNFIVKYKFIVAKNTRRGNDCVLT